MNAFPSIQQGEVLWKKEITRVLKQIKILIIYLKDRILKCLEHKQGEKIG